MKNFENLTIKECREALEKICRSRGERGCIECILGGLNHLEILDKKAVESVMGEAKEMPVFEEVRQTVSDICYKISPDGDGQCQERCPLAVYGSCMRKMFTEMLNRVGDWNVKFFGK